MNRLIKNIFLLLFVGVQSQIALAQNVGFLSVSSNETTAAVFADTLYLGSADGAVFKIKEGSYQVSLIRQEDIASWDAQRIKSIVNLTAGDTTYLNLDFPLSYRFNSFPTGASVTNLEDGSLLGVTPFTYLAESNKTKGEFRIRKSGYLDYVSDNWNEVNISIILDLENEDKESRIKTFERQATPRSGRLVTASLLAATTAAAALSIHYKFKADRLYDQYVEITDPALRPNILKYDRYAGAALGVMQGGLVILAVRLAF